jgi:predicted nucleotidyltransferase
MRDAAEAEVLFGSASRGDSDDLSDRDILIVDSDIELLRSRRHRLAMQGFSVASYTWRKLIHLSERGALFCNISN